MISGHHDILSLRLKEKSRLILIRKYNTFQSQNCICNVLVSQNKKVINIQKSYMNYTEMYIQLCVCVELSK